MSYKLKFVARDIYPKYWVIHTYYENVEVKDGYAEVEKEATLLRLLKEGFIEVTEDKEPVLEDDENLKTEKKTKASKKTKKNKEE